MKKFMYFTCIFLNIMDLNASAPAQTGEVNLRNSMPDLHFKIQDHMYPFVGEMFPEEYIKKLHENFGNFSDDSLNKHFQSHDLGTIHQNDVGLTPLHLAVKYHRYDLIPYLVARGANVNAVTKQDNSVLDMMDGSSYIPKSLEELQKIRRIRQLLVDAGARYGIKMQARLDKAGGHIGAVTMGR